VSFFVAGLAGFEGLESSSSGAMSSLAAGSSADSSSSACSAPIRILLRTHSTKRAHSRRLGRLPNDVPEFMQLALTESELVLEHFAHEARREFAARRVVSVPPATSNRVSSHLSVPLVLARFTRRRAASSSWRSDGAMVVDATRGAERVTRRVRHT
jgi:hypothetical protein